MLMDELVDAIIENNVDNLKELLILYDLDPNFYIEYKSSHALSSRVIHIQRKEIDVNGRTPLDLATSLKREDMVQLLVENGADVNMKNAFGKTALMFAAASGNKSMVKLLISLKADPYVTDCLKWNSLSYACFEERKEIVAFLLQRFNWPPFTLDSSSPLKIASDKGSFELISMLTETTELIDIENI